MGSFEPGAKEKAALSESEKAAGNISGSQRDLSNAVRKESGGSSLEDGIPRRITVFSCNPSFSGHCQFENSTILHDNPQAVALRLNILQNSLQRIALIDQIEQCIKEKCLIHLPQGPSCKKGAHRSERPKNTSLRLLRHNQLLPIQAYEAGAYVFTKKNICLIWVKPKAYLIVSQDNHTMFFPVLQYGNDKKD